MKYKKGDILESSWGYEQTNVSFYRVEKVSARFITLIRLKKLVISGNNMTSTATPLTAEVDGGTFRRAPRSSGYVAITSYEYADLWDGLPKNQTHYA